MDRAAVVPDREVRRDFSGASRTGGESDVSLADNTLVTNCRCTVHAADTDIGAMQVPRSAAQPLDEKAHDSRSAALKKMSPVCAACCRFRVSSSGNAILSSRTIVRSEPSMSNKDGRPP